MATLWQDIRYAIRMLLRTPGFTVVVVVILALGIGANTAIFSIVNGVLLRPLPFANPQRVVQIFRQRQKSDRADPFNNMLDCLEIQKRNHVFAGVAAISPTGFVDTSSEEPQRIGGARVPAAFFDLLGVRPMLGRGFRPEEERPGQEHVVVLSYEYWTQHYGANAGILGQDITLQEEIWSREGITSREGIYTVIGVMPASFWCPDRRSLWVPLVITAEQSRESGTYDSYLIARLGPGITLGQAQAEVDVIAGQLRQERPPASGDHNFLLLAPRLPPAQIKMVEEMLSRRVAPLRFNMQLLSLFAALALILAAVGLYGLMAFFVSQRTHEIGIRMALGARRVDVLRSVVGQGFKLTLVGTGLGLAGAWALTRLIVSLLYAVSPTDPLTFVCVALLLGGVALLACYLPARRAARIDPMVALRYE